MEKSSRLKILRVLNGYTQDSLATQIGIPRSALSIWEGGKYGPSEESTPRLSHVLRVTSGYLTYGDPPIATAVWLPVVPKREHHQKTLISDIESLCPSFFAENDFNAVLPGELSDDGLAFLLGHGFAEHNTVSAGRQTKEVYFTCLLLADQRLVNSFKTAFEQAKVKMYGAVRLPSWSIETFNADALNKMMTRVPGFTCAVSELSRSLADLRERGGKCGNAHPALGSIFRSFVEIVRLYKISDTAVPALAELFVSKCDELAYLPDSKVKYLEIMTEVEQMLKSFGCERITSEALEGTTLKPIGPAVTTKAKGMHAESDFG